MADESQIFQAFKIILNPDGSFTRYERQRSMRNLPENIIVTDIPLNPIKKTFIRVYQPSIVPSTSKLPLIIFFPGGAFIISNASLLVYHDVCMQMTTDLPAIILSVEYSLAPENRLPSAYEDALEAILWVKTHGFKSELEYSFFENADFSKCFLMGSSSGANVTYQVGLQLPVNLEPFKINGLIIISPLFGGVERSNSELELENDDILPLMVADFVWKYALPVGADRDHEYCNPTTEGAYAKNVENIKRFPRCYIRGYGEDPLLDRQKKFVKMLEDDGVSVAQYFSQDGSHASELTDSDKRDEMVAGVKDLFLLPEYFKDDIDVLDYKFNNFLPIKML